MKDIGIVRKVDGLGRIVIPMNLRRSLDINENDLMEVFVDGDCIILKKYSPYNACMITGEVSDDNLMFANGKIILSREGVKIILNELQQLLEGK